MNKSTNFAMGTVLRSVQQAPNLLCDASCFIVAHYDTAWRLMGNIILARRRSFSAIAEVCPSYSDSIFLGDFAERMLLCALIQLLFIPWRRRSTHSRRLEGLGDVQHCYSCSAPCVLWYSEMLRVRGEKEINARWLAQFLMSNPRILGYVYDVSPPPFDGEAEEAWSACLGMYEHWPNKIAKLKQLRHEAELAEHEQTPRDYPPNPRDELCQQAEKDFVDASRLMHDVSAVEALERPENRETFTDYDWLASEYQRVFTKEGLGDYPGTQGCRVVAGRP